MESKPDRVARGLQHLAVDDLLEFGAYPQSSRGGGKEPIRWRVLDRSHSGVLLLSDRILDCKRFHHEVVETTWRDCELRAWLNAEFSGAAFGAEERRMIESTTCTDNGDGAPDTADSVFLLSVEEVRALTDPTDGGRPRRRAIGTEFALAPKTDRCRLYVYDKGVERDYVVEDGVEEGCSWWWTRTQLQVRDGSSSRAAFIGARGHVKSYGRVDLACYGVRPAIWLRLPIMEGRE